MTTLSVQVTHPGRLPKTVQTLKRMGLSPAVTSKAGSSPLTIAPYPSNSLSCIPRKVGRSVPPLLVPKSTTPAKTLALLRQLGASSPGPFFAAGRSGQINAALFAAACLASAHPKIRRNLDTFRARQTSSVPFKP